MPPSISDNHKSKVGRPATGVTPMVGVRLSDDLRQKVDDYAERNAISRAEAMRRLVEAALAKGG